MKFKLIVLFVMITTNFSQAQEKSAYEIYALKFRESGFKSPATEIAIGANESDSVRACNMFWLLQSEDGKNILVDVGFVDTSNTANIKIITPTEALGRLDIEPKDISDIIVTHPHIDHIGGIDIFPSATVWMQKNDFNYFIDDAWQEGGIAIGFSKEDVQKLKDIELDGRLKLIDGDNIEIMPGIKVFTGSKHTFENQYLLVNSTSGDKILLASDAVWFYYNLENLLPIPLSFDNDAYVAAMKRMKSMVTDTKYIIPGHDNKLFSKFPEVAEWVVKIE